MRSPIDHKSAESAAADDDRDLIAGDAVLSYIREFPRDDFSKEILRLLEASLTDEERDLFNLPSVTDDPNVIPLWRP